MCQELFVTEGYHREGRYDGSENSHAVRLGNCDTDEKVAELRMLWFSLGVKRKDISRND